MLTAIRRFLAPPSFPEDEEKTRQAQLQNTALYLIIVVLVAANIVTILSNILIGQTPTDPSSSIVLVLALGGGIVLMHRGYVRLVSWILILSIVWIITYTILLSGSISSPTSAGYVVAVVIAGLLLGEKWAFVVAGINVVILIILNNWDAQGVIEIPAGSTDPRSAIITYASIFFVVAVLLQLAVRGVASALTRARKNEQDIRELASSLEQRVKERTRALSVSAEVSRRLSTILDPDQLVLEVVEQVQAAFRYYHAHIYLLDDTGQALKMVGGTGEAGQIMLERGHSIPLERGLVGRAARTNAPVLVPDTENEPGWLPNPLLPETKAEIAVPIAFGDTALGVLDVQHNVVNGLTKADVELLQTIASQVAVALQNARQYELVRARETALRESEERYRLFIEYSGEAIYELDFETKRFKNANQSLLSLLGYTLEETRSLTLYDIVPFGKDKIDLVLERVKKERTFLVGETNWRRKDGTLVDAYVNLSAVQQENQTIILGQGIDITHRKQIQQALEKRAERDRVLARISSKIRGAVTMEQVLQVATQVVRHATGADRSVAIIEPNEETMTLLPISGRDL